MTEDCRGQSSPASPRSILRDGAFACAQSPPQQPCCAVKRV